MHKQMLSSRQRCGNRRPARLNAAACQGAGEDSPCYEADCRPVHVALIDATGGPVFLELVKGAVLAALEALPSCALFGLATFSCEVKHTASHASFTCHNRSLASKRHVHDQQAVTGCTMMHLASAFLPCVGLQCLTSVTNQSAVLDMYDLTWPASLPPKMHTSHNSHYAKVLDVRLGMRIT